MRQVAGARLGLPTTATSTSIVLSNPRAQGHAVQLLSAAIAGPLLIIGGVQSSGAAWLRVSMVLAGAGLTYWNATALRQEMQPLIEST
jgi:hypothetical protein